MITRRLQNGDFINSKEVEVVESVVLSRSLIRPSNWV